MEPCTTEQSPLLRDPVSDQALNLRSRLVEEAKSWLRTPFHSEARVKCGGVDCGMLLLEIFEASGLIPHLQPDHYPPDFAMHRDKEWYLATIAAHCREVFEPPQSGDVIIFKVGRLYSHGGLVIDWPTIIHASSEDGCVAWGDVGKLPLSARTRKIFRHRDL